MNAERTEPEVVDETYGVYLNTLETRVFELALQGVPVKRIAEREAMRVGLVRAFLLPGQPVRLALTAARSAIHRETEEQRRNVMQMTLDEAQDQLSRPDSEISPAEKRELMYQVWDRMGLPKQSTAKVEATSTVLLVPAVAVSAALAEAGQRLLASAWGAPRPTVLEVEAVVEPE